MNSCTQKVCTLEHGTMCDKDYIINDGNRGYNHILIRFEYGGKIKYKKRY